MNAPNEKVIRALETARFYSGVMLSIEECDHCDPTREGGEILGEVYRFSGEALESLGETPKDMRYMGAEFSRRSRLVSLDAVVEFLRAEGDPDLAGGYHDAAALLDREFEGGDRTP